MNYRRGGFSLIEVLIFGSISCFAIYCVAQLLIKPYQMQKTLDASEAPREANRALDTFVNDLKEAAPGSIPWQVLGSTSPLTFAKSQANPITYGYEGPGNGPGALARVEGSSETVVLEPIDAPSAAAPLFQYDPSLHIVMIDVRYHPAGKPPIRLVRRVALSQ